VIENEGPKLEQPENILVKSRFHRLLLLFHLPSDWPLWKVISVIILILLPVVVCWWVFSGRGRVAGAAVLIMATFFLFDALLFYSLPKRGISYGPWQAQLIILAAPRAFVALVISFFVPLVGATWGLLLLFVIQLTGTAALIYGTLIEPFRLGTTFLDIVVDNLPPGSEPIRILHLSDIHLERITRREKSLQQLAKDTKPDLILMTGDYLNLSFVHDPEAHRELHDLLADFSAPYGVYASLGSPTVDEREFIPDFFDDLPIQLLLDEWTELDLGEDRGLVLMGVDCSHHLPTDRGRLDDLVAGAPNTVPRVLLHHAPDLMPEAGGHGIDLYLCGHTHGGQVRLPIFGAILTSSQYGKKYEMGLYASGRTRMYVSRGIGLEGLSAPRIRFLAPPEITLVTLHS